MAKVGRRAQQRRTKELIGGTLAIILVIVIVGAATYYMQLKEGHGLDARMCPVDVDGGPKGHIVLLVDKTDPLTFTQKQALQVTLEELVKKKTPVGYLLTLFVLGEDFKANAQPLLELCNPGNGSGKSAYTENLERLRKKYEEGFVQEVMKQSDSMMAQSPAKWSPIFEMLQLVSINAFRKNSIDGPRKLIIISDMLHNTQQFSMYKGNFDYQTYSSSDYGNRTQLEMVGVKVELDYLMNTPQLQTKRNVDFWEQHFRQAKAVVVSVNPL